jgi:Zn ribbon nucleic-acid-binding protein
MAKGNECPACGNMTFHDEGSHRKCSSCGYIGWSWQQPVEGVGKGKGNYCPNCSNQTLHKIVETENFIVRRCSTCDFSSIQQLKS